MKYVNRYDWSYQCGHSHEILKVYKNANLLYDNYDSLSYSNGRERTF